MRIDEMIAADDLRTLAAEFHERFGMYLVLDDHLALTNPRRIAAGLRELAGLLQLAELEEQIDPAAIDAPAIPPGTAQELRQIEAMSKALR